MRIGYLSIRSSVGGLENHIYFMSRELNNLGHEVIIYEPIEEEKFVSDFKEEDGIKVKYLPIKTPKVNKILNKYNGFHLIGFLTAFLNKAKYFFYRKTIAEFIAQDKCDIIHQHDFIADIFSTKILSKKFPVILTNHTGEYLFFRRIPLGNLILKYLLNHYKYIIGPSVELTPIGIVKNSITIHNGVDLRIFNDNMNKEELRKKFGFSSNSLIIFCPRRWAPTKGVIYLMKAICDFNFNDNILFLFAGNDFEGFPKYKENIMEIYNNVKNKNSIILLNNLNINEMAYYYRLSDITIIPSLMEAVSLSAVESMACGTPVISTNVGGMPELIKDLYNGILIEPKRPDLIAKSINDLYKNKDLYNKLVKNSLITAKNYTWEQIALKNVNIYKNVIDIPKV